jgi:hypothetical protein
VNGRISSGETAGSFMLFGLQFSRPSATNYRLSAKAHRRFLFPLLAISECSPDRLCRSECPNKPGNDEESHHGIAQNDAGANSRVEIATCVAQEGKQANRCVVTAHSEAQESGASFLVAVGIAMPELGRNRLRPLGKTKVRNGHRVCDIPIFHKLVPFHCLGLRWFGSSLRYCRKFVAT